MNIEESAERYMREPEFHCLVDFMINMLRENKISTGELRDATTFAAHQFNLIYANRYMHTLKDLEGHK